MLLFHVPDSRGPSKMVFILIAHGANKQEIIMPLGRTNFQTSKAFLSLLSQKITFWYFKKERRYIIHFQVASKRSMVYKVIKPAGKEQKVSFDAEKT